jgi:hypothetical protein
MPARQLGAGDREQRHARLACNYNPFLRRSKSSRVRRRAALPSSDGGLDTPPRLAPWRPPYVPQTYLIMPDINLLCLLALLGSVVPLFRLRRAGLWICNILFSFEIIYFFCNSALSLALAMAGSEAKLAGMRMAAAGGIGDMGISPQLLTGYPVIAFIVLNIAYRKLLPADDRLRADR